MLKQTIVGCIALSCLVSVANASSGAPAKTVSTVHAVLNDWTLVPTLSDGKVESFVALRDSDGTGSNVTAVWFVLKPTGVWHSLAWQNSSRTDAMGYVKAVLSLDSATDQQWPFSLAPTGLGTEPEPFGRGVFDGDPMEAIVDNLTDPEPLLQTLTDSGWSSVRIAIQTGEFAETQDELLSKIGAIIEADIDTNANGALISQFVSVPDDSLRWKIKDANIGPDGHWYVNDFLSEFDAPAGSNAANWQSVASDTAVLGEQTFVLETGIISDGSSTTEVHGRLIVRTHDRMPPTVTFAMTATEPHRLWGRMG